jgi:hypothetical protein
VEYPAWADDRRSPGPLFGLADPNGNRNLHEALALACYPKKPPSQPV